MSPIVGLPFDTFQPFMFGAFPLPVLVGVCGLGQVVPMALRTPVYVPWHRPELVGINDFPQTGVGFLPGVESNFITAAHRPPLIGRPLSDCVCTD